MNIVKRRQDKQILEREQHLLKIILNDSSIAHFFLHRCHALYSSLTETVIRKKKQMYTYVYISKKMTVIIKHESV